MKRLFRDRWDKKVAGVCGGLGHYFKIDPTIIRLFLIVICILTAVLPVIVLYTVAWMLIPLGPKAYMKFACKKLYRSRTNRKISGICGGIGEAFNIDPTIIRVLMLFALFLTAIIPLLISYLLGTFIIPENPHDEPQ